MKTAMMHTRRSMNLIMNSLLEVLMKCQDCILKGCRSDIPLVLESSFLNTDSVLLVILLKPWPWDIGPV